LETFRGNLLLLLASVIWGTAFVAQATGMEYVGPLTFTFVRFLLGAITILPFIILFEKKLFFKTIKKPNVFLLIFCTSLALGFGATTQQYALLNTDVSNAAFITALYVPLVPIILTLVLRKRLHNSIWLAILVCLIGLYLLTSESSSLAMRYSDTLLVFSSIAFACQIILTDIYLKKNNLHFTFAFSQYFLIFIFTFIISLIFESPTLSNISLEFFEIFYAGVLSVGIAYTLQIIGQKNTKPAPAAIILSMEAVFAAIAGWIIIDQSMSFIKIIGCILIFSGIIIAQVFPLLTKNKESIND
tara:strand:- start:151 stop:1053 length:903 start_codon:yes stop_codon:yes gene_type:complete